MTLILIVRSIEGIAIVSDSTTTVTSMRTIEGEEQLVEFHIYGREKIARVGNFGVVHTGLAFVSEKTVTQIIELIEFEEITVESVCSKLKETFDKELLDDSIVKLQEPGDLILNLGVVGYKDGIPFVHRIIYLRPEEGEDLYEVIESEDTFTQRPYGIDYFGDFEFIQLVIRAAKERDILKPFDILTLHETLEMGRTLMRFLIEFERYMVKFTVGYPIESAVITQRRGFEWIDQIKPKEFHYDHE